MPVLHCGVTIDTYILNDIKIKKSPAIDTLQKQITNLVVKIPFLWLTLNYTYFTDKGHLHFFLSRRPFYSHEKRHIMGHSAYT